MAINEREFARQNGWTRLGKSEAEVESLFYQKKKSLLGFPSHKAFKKSKGLNLNSTISKKTSKQKLIPTKL